MREPHFTADKDNNYLEAHFPFTIDMVMIVHTPEDSQQGEAKIMYVNPAFCLHTGYSVDELIGLPLSIFNGASAGSVFGGRVKDAVKDYHALSERGVTFKKDGTPFWVEITVSPVFQTSGRERSCLLIMRDVTNSIRMLNGHQTRIEKFERILQATRTGCWTWDAVGGLCSLDDVASSLIGYESDELQNVSYMSLRDLIHQDDLANWSDARSVHLGGDTQVEEATFRMRHRSGHWIWIRSRGRVVRRMPDNTPALMIGTYADISEGVTSRADSRRHPTAEAIQDQCDLDATINALSDAWLLVNANLEIEIARSPKSVIFGCAIDKLAGRPLLETLTEPARTILKEAFRHAGVVGIMRRVEFPVEVNGELRHYECSIASKTSRIASYVTGYVLILREISDYKTTQEHLALLSTKDLLTGLLNRRALFERLVRLSVESAARGTGYAVLLIDLDHFQDLNDSHGHDLGDELLRQVALRLTSQLRPADLIARIAGDEFVVVISDLPSGGRSHNLAACVADKLGACLRDRFNLQGLSYEIDCSIGIAFGAGDGGDIDVSNVLKAADIAMYQAKSAGRSLIRFYDPQVQTALETRALLEQDLRHAVYQNQLELFCQPIVDSNRSIVGYQLSLQWNHPTRGILYPSDFIPAAEYNGQIIAIGEWVLERAAHILRDWARDGINDNKFLSIKISARHLRDINFLDNIQNILLVTNVAPSLLKIELSESVMQDDMEATIIKMHQLRSLGIEISLDNFGTGYSSMSYIRRLPVQQIKIDRSFFSSEPNNGDGYAIVHMIMRLARTLGVTVRAEGIETETHFQYLSSIGCHFFQGHLFGRPEPVLLLEKNINQLHEERRL